MVKAVLFALLLSLGACGTVSSITARNADADGVTYEFPNDQQDEARHQAMLYCANLGRRAALKSTTHENDDHAIAVFDCR